MMQNIIPHSKLLSSTILENSICWDTTLTVELLKSSQMSTEIVGKWVSVTY